MFTLVGAPGHEQWLLVAVYAKAWSTALVAAMRMLLLLPFLPSPCQAMAVHEFSPA